MFYNENNMGTILNIIGDSVNVMQESKYHPEGDVRNHTLQVFNCAFRESNDVELIMAALTHDIGKAFSIDHRNHEKISVYVLEQEEIITNRTLCIVANHMRIKTYLDGSMKRLEKSTDLANHYCFADLVRLTRWDNMGRNPNKKMTFDRENIINKLNTCLEIEKQELLSVV